MSKEFLDLYAELMEAEKNKEAKREEVNANHEHEWFVVQKIPGECAYYCPICKELKRTSEPIEGKRLHVVWIPLYRAVLERNIEKANEEIKELHNKGVMYTCDLQTFSNMIEKYGYRLNVDTNKIEVI